MRLPELIPGTLLRRYKRFLADVALDDGREVTAWCPNPGRMTSCMAPGWRVWLSAAPPGRKLAWTWELSQDPDGPLVLVNTQHPNAVVAEAVAAGIVGPLAGYRSLRREVKQGDSRFDLVLDDHPDDPRRCFVEVKSATLRVAPGLAAFPDAVTARGRKHLDHLSALAGHGHRAVLLFALSRDDCDALRPADEIDPAYGDALRAAAAAGVEILARQCRLSTTDVVLTGPATVRLR
ncbi:MAG: DNA/RNA nuclease SfsA [Alphaproteobacteria bacterium]|nr:DNA/RNA nuclease SfsA [Alphaproteobacteria bacterium]